MSGRGHKSGTDDAMPLAAQYLPFHRPSLGAAEERAVIEVLRSGWLARGRKTAEFEEMFADFVGARHAIALNSCTAGLHLALLCAGIGPGAEVITTPFTFAATANVILHTGAKVVFADIDPASLNLDPAQVGNLITTRTRALLPVHFGGQPCDMTRIRGLARRHGLAVIEDAAHALGASFDNRPIGSLSDFTAFSFYATKNITTGEGGMLTTNNDDLASRARVLSLHGMSVDSWQRYGRSGHSYYEVQEPGFKYNMFDLQAALGVEQLKRCDEMTARRRELAALYDRELADCPFVELLRSPSCNEDAHHLYVVRLRLERLRLDRDGIAGAMENQNIGVSVHFRALHLHPYYRKQYGFNPADFPIANEMSDRVLSLPLYPSLTDEGATRVASVLRAVLEHHSV
ncbi:MAG: DegT/DnrJ/EryC1/StrS family aminotransferase [Thermoleophilia bacterium]